MHHLAIMKKSWKLTAKILSGEKTIESRWYKFKRAPWNKIKVDDVVYFKDSGGPVTIKAEVGKVMQFADLNPEKVGEILNKYGGSDGLGVSDIPRFIEMFRDKKYCILVFLRNPKTIAPFEVDKKGYGMMAAWISVSDIESIRKKRIVPVNLF